VVAASLDSVWLGKILTSIIVIGNCSARNRVEIFLSGVTHFKVVFGPLSPSY
jgi:hypothetical protein